MRSEPGRNWSEAELHVFEELKRLSQEVGANTKEVAAMNGRLIAIEVKSSVLGMIFGALAAWVGSLVKPS